MSELKGIEKYKQELIKNARYLVQKGKGILAADETIEIMKNRFDGAKIENTEENRRDYRELLFTTDGLEQYISGIILFDETVYQKTKEGKRFIEILKSKGIIPGINVDKGLIPIINSENETLTQGLDDLGKRCGKYYEEGCRFTKWRAVFRVGKNTPSLNAIKENSAGLARFAVISQENGLVPIVEPEVSCEGAHSIDECAEKSEKVFHEVFNRLFDYGVLFEGMLLKPNMVIPGLESKNIVKPEEIAWKSVRTLTRTVPAAVPGIVFLSGGQTEFDSTVNLNSMNLLKGVRIPWNLSFSFGRALQYSCLRVWVGKKENIKEAQNTLLQMAKNNSEATKGIFKANEDNNKEEFTTDNYTY